MFNSTVEKPRNYRRQSLIMTVVAMVVVYIIWNIPALDLVLYPLRLFTTYVHEAGHAFATLISGGEVVGFSVNLNGSGVTQRIGGADWLIGPAGYLGAALFGSLLFFFVNRMPRFANGIAVALGIGIAIFTVLFSGGNFLAVLLGVGFGMAMMAMGLRAHPALTMFALNTLAVSTALEAFLDLRYLMFAIDASLASGGAVIKNDAVQFSERVTPFISPSVIALTWAGIAGIMFAMAIYYGAWKPLQEEISDSYQNIATK